ncbi:MAG TPA: PAS domain-containing protein [Bryobacteraceae bacterium]|nr:PAS domain-containing protein [Bryobacteraceae bacterium]
MNGNPQKAADDATPVDYKQLFEAAPGLFIVLLPDHPIYTIISVSDAYGEATLTKRHEILGRGMFEVFPDNPDDNSATGVTNLQASLGRVLANRVPDAMAVQKYDIRLPVDQGGGFEERYWSVVNSPVLSPDGSVRWIIHRAEDVTEFLRLKRMEAEHGQLAQAERIRADKMEVELFLRSRELVEMKRLTAERDRADDALRQSEAEFRQVADSMPQLVWVTRPDGYHEWYNRRWYEYTGTTPEQAVGAGWNDFFHGEDQDRAWATWRHSLATGEPYEIEYRCKRHDGVYRWFLGRALPIRDESGAILRWFGTCTDIDQQKQSESERKRSEALLQLVIDKVPGLVSYLDPEARYQFVNQHYLEWFGNRAVIGRKVLEVVGEEAFRRAWPYLERALAGEEVRFEEVLPYKHSSARHVRVSYSPDRADDDTVRGVVAMVQDITDQKQMEVALRHSKERLQQVFAQAPVGVAVLQGRDLVVELANSEFQAFFPGRELVGRSFQERIPKESQEILHSVLTTGEPFVAHEYLIPLDRDGDGVVEDFWFTFVYQPLREVDDSVQSVVVVAVDVTTHVRARKEQQRINRELEEFAYVASHDLQEPLRMVNIYSQLLLKEFCGTDPNAQKYAAFVEQGVNRMERLIRDLLTYSQSVQSDELPTEAADLAAAFNEAMSVLKSRIEESAALITVEALPPVRGETAQIALVFQNLLSNALKYRNKECRPEIHVSAKLDGEHCVICVQDNGIGFQQQYAGRIFGLFKRLHKEEYPGTGLGLAICQRIIERYGGRMWAEGAPNEGAKLYFSLPCIAKD